VGTQGRVPSQTNEGLTAKHNISRHISAALSRVIQPFIQHERLCR
jgi:hypothetical protein